MLTPINKFARPDEEKELQITAHADGVEIFKTFVCLLWVGFRHCPLGLGGLLSTKRSLEIRSWAATSGQFRTFGLATNCYSTYSRSVQTGQ